MEVLVEKETKYHVGIDIGGTFTDLVLSDHEGNVNRAKALTTHGKYTEGIIHALKKISKKMNTDIENILSKTELFINGTTIVTNAIAELKGDIVGLITTNGFKDTMRIARSARTNDYNMHTQTSLPEIVKRSAIVEVDERVDSNGKVLIELNVEQVKERVKYLVEEEKVESFAVCLLWSFKNPQHEQQIKAIVQEMYPDKFITISSEIYPVEREYERMVTTVLNSFSGQAVEKYVDILEGELRERGLQVPVGLMQSIGGVLSSDEAKYRAINLINSGPVGGVLGANNLGKLLGLKDIITADMGGTSFDTALIKDNQLGLAHRAELNRFMTGLSMVDITAIGAGGGSICWIDERNAPRVGPESAGSFPGPACYGQGGENPAITDVVVALGMINPDLFLGGEMELNKEASVQAIKNKIADPLGWDVNQAASGLYRIVVNSMSNAARSVSIEKGFDPRDFTVISYGGASPLFIAPICKNLGIKKVIIPANSSVFSAYGLLWSDNIRSFAQTVNWNVNLGETEEINDLLNGLVEQAKDALHSNGFAEENIQVIKEGDFKFSGQAFEITIPLPDGNITADDKEEIIAKFVETYERLYGEGTAWEGSDVIMLNCRVTGVGKTVKPKIKSNQNKVKGEVTPHKFSEVFLPDINEARKIPTFVSQGIYVGDEICGPAIVEAGDTTIYVPENSTISKDEYLNYVMEIR
ncbi:5-oxoprolinase (ATP-hydrolyzing) [Neobacillus bataviensis LMG 21833]|uniref:5-oxoprolinase (ATP-hydrolyzing) n=1 Tax=Neobacillus bataviensis LMG 21833 TaxID=1117379 RepID=K6DEP8_9BACI|nr:hydantoinase/oxoprolinase family protein [Neobacillus bataviensis]EKN70992.1 5-oxoprolinase (ATP-hydrolyzing) [Neobacillus bataviensis LMG 21833]